MNGMIKIKIKFKETEYNIRKILLRRWRNTKKDVNTHISKIIVLLELIIYCSFIYLDFNTKYTSRYSTTLKYTGIILCLILSLIIDNRCHDKEDVRLLQIAFCFTAAADLCLGILNYYKLGIILFCFVQLTYIVRHNRGSDNVCKLSIIISSVIVVFLLEVIINNFNFGVNGVDKKLIMIGSMYSILLCCSVFTAWRTFSGKLYPKYSCYFISIGMTLFFLCDINVGVSGVISHVFINGINIEAVSRFLVWIFYLPSQVLLALSGYKNK